MRLHGDVMIAAVCGEIEKTQQGDAVGAEYRGYAAGSRYLVTHGGLADMCLLGEPTEGKVVLGSLRLVVGAHLDAGAFHPHGVLGREARPELDPAHARGARRGARVDPELGGRSGERYRGAKAIVNVGAIAGRLRLARVADAASHRPLPRRAGAADEADDGGARSRCSTWCAACERFPDYGVEGEVYVTAPGAEIDEGHELVQAVDAAHEEVFGAPPERDVDALVLGCVRADALRRRRRSTTAPRPGCSTPSTARTSRSRGS